MPTINGIAYTESDNGSPSYTFGPGNTRVEKTYRVSWNDRVEFVRAILGYSKIGNRTDPLDHRKTYVSRFIPHSIADFISPVGVDFRNRPTTPIWLYATNVTRFNGVGPIGTYDPIGQTPRYTWAMITVMYESLTYRVRSNNDMLLDDINEQVAIGVPEDAAIANAYIDESKLTRNVTHVLKPSAEFLQLPRGYMKIVDYAVGPTFRTGPGVGTIRLVSSIEIIYTWHAVPFVPDVLLGGKMVGRVNGTAFTDGITTYNPGTLLLLSVDMKPYRGAVGNFVHDFTYRMKYFEPIKQRGHNFVLYYNGNNSEVFYYKLTSNGKNDALPIIGNAEENTLTATAPYQVTHQAEDGVGQYRYAEFRNLFRWKPFPDNF